MIHWELCKIFKFDHMNKWYMHNPTSVQVNDTISSGILTSAHLISARRPDLIIKKKKKKKRIKGKAKKKKKRICKIPNFAVLADQGVKFKESEKKNKYLDLARELKRCWT